MSLAYTAPTWENGSGTGISASQLQALSDCMEGLVQGSDKAIHNISINNGVMTVTYADGTIETDIPANMKGISSISKTGTSGNVDTYTITYTDGTTSTFTVTNGTPPTITITATADATSSDNPTVTVTKSGTDAAPTYAMAFSGLKGKKSDDNIVNFSIGDAGTSSSHLYTAKGYFYKNGVLATTSAYCVIDVKNKYNSSITLYSNESSFTGSFEISLMDGWSHFLQTIEDCTVEVLIYSDSTKDNLLAAQSLNIGKAGQNGTDGYSPEVTITTITGGHRVNITDVDHPSGQSFDVMDGAGSGDMSASTYDPQSAVANAGGIPSYVSDRYSTSDTAETTLSDDDKIPFYDDSASATRSSTWANIKAKLKSYFDGIYAAITAIGTYESGSTASKAYAVGKHFYKDGKFCTAKTAISSGETFTLNTNYVEGTVAESLPLVPYDITSYDDIDQTIVNDGGGTVKSYSITQDELRVMNAYISARQNFAASGNYKKWEFGVRVKRNNTNYVLSDYTIPASLTSSQLGASLNLVFPVKSGDTVEVYIWNYLGASCRFDGKIYFD